MAKFFTTFSISLFFLLAACGGAPPEFAQAENARMQKEFGKAKAGYQKLLQKSLLGFEQKTFYRYRLVEADFNLGNFRIEHYKTIEKKDEATSLETLRLFLLAIWHIQKKEGAKALVALKAAPEKTELLGLLNSNLALVEPIEQTGVHKEYVAYLKSLSAFIPVQEQVNGALASAKELQLPLLLEFGADWCPDCRKLAQILAAPHLRQFVKENFLHFKIDVGRFDRNLSLVYRFNVKAIAKLAVISKNGKTLSNKVFEPATGGERGLTPALLKEHLQDTLKGHN